MPKNESADHEKVYHWFDRPCGAKARTNGGSPCKKPALRGKNRCALHGGKSTGPKTEEGKLKAARANYKNGLYTNAARLERRRMQLMMRWRKDLNDI